MIAPRAPTRNACQLLPLSRFLLLIQAGGVRLDWGGSRRGQEWGGDFYRFGCLVKCPGFRPWHVLLIFLSRQLSRHSSRTGFLDLSVSAIVPAFTADPYGGLGAHAHGGGG